MRPRDLFRGPRGAMGGGPGGPRGLRETSRRSHVANGLVWGVSWWFMRHICLYIGVKIFSVGGCMYGFTRGSTRGPREPKKLCSKQKQQCQFHFQLDHFMQTTKTILIIFYDHQMIKMIKYSKHLFQYKCTSVRVASKPCWITDLSISTTLPFPHFYWAADADLWVGQFL